MAASKDLELIQIDAVTAFLNGELAEEIYMRQLEGFAVHGKEYKMCYLRKAIYGLKQAGGAWADKLKQHLETFGYKSISGDGCLYVSPDG